MRTVVWRGLAFGVFLAPVLGAAAQPPLDPVPEKLPTKLPLPGGPPARGQLKASLEALIGDRKDLPEDNVAAERARLQAQLLELLKRINSAPAAGPGPRPPVVPPKKTEVPPPEGTQPIDTLRRAMNLYRDNDVPAALAAFRLGEGSQLSREDRAFSRYMTACCLRRLGRVSEAAVIYREVADARDDEFLAESAVAQLSLMRSAQDLEAQLEQLRSRLKSR